MLNELKDEAEYRKENFEYVQTSLKDLEGVHKMVLPSMFEVSHQNYNEQQEAQQEAAYEFKIENLDPNRLLNKWEQERMHRERKRIAQRRKA